MSYNVEIEVLGEDEVLTEGYFMASFPIVPIVGDIIQVDNVEYLVLERAFVLSSFDDDVEITLAVKKVGEVVEPNNYH